MGGEGKAGGGWARRWIAVSIAFVFTLTGIITSTPARAATCSNTWGLGAGSFGDAQFGDPANWVEKVAPVAGSNVCFAAGDVAFFNLTRTIETIDVAVGATLTLIGGTLDLTSSTSLGGVFVANGAVINLGKDSTVPSGRTSGAGTGQSGRFASTTGAVLTIEGVFQRAGNNALFLDLDVVNNGSASTAGTLSIASGRTFTNNGTLTVSDGTLTGVNQPRLQNNGVVEFSGGTGGGDAAGVRGLEFNNDGTVRVLGGDVAMVMTGSGSGDWEIGTVGSGTCAAPIGATPTPGARLFFRPNPTITMTAGSVTGPGCANVTPNGTLVAGNGVVWSPGATEISGATLRVGGDRTLPQLRMANGAKVEVVGGTATMAGPISQTSPGQYMRFGGDGRLVVPSNFSVVHVGGNGFEVADSLDVEVNGPLTINAAIILNSTASLVSRGTWTVGPSSSFSPAAGTTLRNEGTLVIDAGTGSIMFGGGAAVDNVGTLRLAGGTIDMRTSLAQVSGGALTGGRIEIADGANMIFFPLLTTLAGELRVEGNGHFDTSFGSTSNALRDITTIQPGGALELAGGANLDLTAGAANTLTNPGRLEIGAGSTLTVGDYLQSAGGTLAVEVGSAAHGAITATSATLGGTLEISPVTAGQPPVTGVVILDAATVTGAFAAVTAPGGGVATIAGGGGPISVDFDAAPEPPASALVVTSTASVTEGTGSGTTNQQVLVTIENPNPVPLPIAWSAVGVTAALDSGAATRDAAVPSGATTLVPGVNVVSVAFTTVADALAESDETFQIVWTPGTPATLVTIVDDDDPPPVLTFGPASLAEAGGEGSIQVTRNSAKAPLTVSVDSIDGSALAETDYAPLASTVTFAAGQLVAIVPVTIIDDDIDEPDETFVLSFANGALTATVTIVDDDEPDNPDDPLPFTLSVEDVTVSEGQTVTLEILVRPPRVGGTGMVELPVELRDGTAVRGLDYFEANGTDGTISVPAAGGTAFAFAFTGDLEDRFEVTEYFDVVFGRAEVPGEQVVARVTIEDNDPFPTVTITSNTPYAEDARLVALNVRLDRAAGTPLEFLMEPVDGSAEDGVDFITFPNIPVRIPAGATEGNLDRLLILDDTEAFEADHEFFFVQAFWSGELVALEEVEIIDNDDGPQARFTRRPSDPVHRVMARDLVEGDTSDATLPLQVELMGEPITAPVVVTVTADSLLADDSDYSVSPTQLTFLPGEGPKAVTVTSRGDTVLEDDETVLLSVQTEFGNSLGRPDDEAHITIVDDDQALTLTPVMATSASEGATVTVTVVADHAPGEFVTIPVTVTGVTATLPGPGEPGDVSIEGIPATLTIAPDATSASFQIPVVDDEVPEPDEVVGVQFGLPNQGRLTVREKQFTIIDDDPVPFDLSVEDVTVSEGRTVMLELLATPTGPAGSVPVQLPVELRDVTAVRGSDYVAASGTDGTITIPAGGGTVFAFVLTGDEEGRFEVTEFFDVLFGRAGVPGEQVTARVTIEDDDPFPTVTITSNEPYGEDAGVVSLNVRLDRAAGSPLGILMTPINGSAELGADFTTFADDVVDIPAGATEGELFRLTIIDDDDRVEYDQESFWIEASWRGERVADEQIRIIDNDVGGQARFVRGSSDVENQVLERDLVEGDTSNSTMPLLVELAGDPITEPLVVDVLAQSDLASDEDYTVSPSQLTFNPGDGPKTVTFTSLADTQLEDDQPVAVILQTEVFPAVRLDDEAHITIVDDDQALTLTPMVASTVSEGATVTVTVVADHAPGEFVTIPVAVTGVTATLPGPGESGDVSLDEIPATLTIAPDATSASFQISVIDDEVPEPDEVVGVQFGVPNQGRLSVREKQFTIVDDDLLPFRLSVGDVTVSEGRTAMLEVVAVPTGPRGSGSVELPVALRDVTAVRGSDYVAANGTDGTISVPAAGGTVFAFVFTGDDEDRFEVTESFDVVFGRAGVPGEQVTARVTIDDDDPFPRVTITSNSPYGEDVGVISLNVRFDRAAGSPVTLLMEPIHDTAYEGLDFTRLSPDNLTIPAGATEGDLYRLTIIDDTDATEPVQEFFVVQAFGPSGERVAAEEVAIIDNEDGPQARFVRGPSDPHPQPPDPIPAFARNVVEGDTSDPTLPLLVELAGDPITSPVVVDVVVDSLLADDSDYSVSPSQLTFNPGDGAKTLMFTSHGDTEVEFDETVLISVQTPMGVELGRPDDEAHITIVDDDDETPAAPTVTQFTNGWASLQAALQDWLAQFDLAPDDAPPVATPALAQHFGLEQLDADLALPATDPANDTLSDLCTNLLALDFELDFVIGGLCGQASPTQSGDVIRARYDTTLADLAKAAGFSADPFNDATDGVLQSLASSLGLDATGGWIGDLDVTLVVGVDGTGFYVDGATALELTIGGSVDVTGSGTVAGAATAVSGRADAELVVTLAPGSPRQRNLAALLEPTIDGSASMALSFSSGPLELGWNGEWSASAAAVTTASRSWPGH